MRGQVAIIVPTLNEGAVIGDLLKALQPARQAGHQLIVSDGGSSDTTVSLARVQVDTVVEGTPGRAVQMNRGAAQTEAEWLWFVHADTRFCHPLNDYLTALKATGRDWGRFDVRLDGQAQIYHLIARMMNLRSCLSGIATGDQALFVRRERFVQLGGFAEIPLMEDIELSRRLKRIERPACVSMALETSARRWQQQGIAATVWLMWRLRLAYFMGASPQALAQRYRICSSPTPKS